MGVPQYSGCTLQSKHSHSCHGDSVRYLIMILALAGVVASGLALKVHYDTGTEPCRINDKWDCGVVNHSPYAEIHGVPVAALGIVGYLLIGVLGFLRRRELLLIAALVGFAFALYLTNIEAHVLEVWCLYCVISQGIIALLTLLSMGWMVSAKMRAKPA
jgi:vitamin-K-epoxide reductase (warfarin-sensitive)